MADGAPKSFFLSEELHHYMRAHSSGIDEIQRALIEETRETVGGLAMMQVAPEQGAFMAMLAAAIGAKQAIEVGTFTGYSALCVARALPADGRLLALDTSEEWTSIGRKYWQKAGIADRIDLRIGPGAETLAALPKSEDFDFAFIDADKPNYRTYYEEILLRLRPGGLLLVDNVMWGGSVVNPDANDANSVAIRAFNDHVAADERVDKVMLAISDGLTIARKR